MNKRVVHFYGDGQWAYYCLQLLLNKSNYIVAAVILRSVSDKALESLCKKNGIIFISTQNINDFDFDTIPEATLGISISYDQIFKQHIIDKYSLGIINLHAAALPNYKGRNALNWSIINGEKETKISIHWVDAGIDTGNIIYQMKIPIGLNEAYDELLNRCYKESSKALDEALKKIEQGKEDGVPQSGIQEYPIICSRRRAGDEKINWEWDSERIHNFVRALATPGLYATAFLNETEVKVKKTVFLPKAPKYIDICGAVLKVDKDSFIVKTGDSYIKIIEWCTSSRIKLGDRFT